MRAHVFAVWDFMSLLKRLQRDLTCTEVPWTPPARPYRLAPDQRDRARRGERPPPDGEPASHLDIYIDAMREIGADTSQFDRFLTLVEQGMEPLDALHTVGAPITCARSFATPCMWRARTPPWR
jgi:hypothetical protein